MKHAERLEVRAISVPRCRCSYTCLLGAALITGCGEAKVATPDPAAVEVPPNASFSSPSPIEGASPSSVRHAVYGAAELTLDNDDDGTLEPAGALIVVAADRTDFCDAVVGSFDEAILDAVGVEVAGAFIHTGVITRGALPRSGETIFGDQAIVVVRFSVSDGAEFPRSA